MEDGKWEPGRWWQVLDADGKLWCETSNEQEARRKMRKGDTLWREWVFHDTKFRQVLE